MMRAAMLLGGIVGAGGLVIASVTMNIRFGQSLGASATDGKVFAVISASADILKCFLPFLIAVCWQRARWVAACGGVLLWFLFSAYSFTSGIGFTALSRAEATADRASPARQLNELREDMRRTVMKIDALPATRSQSEILDAMSAAKEGKRWRSTAGCTDVTARLSIAFCDEYAKLEKELEATLRRRALATRRQALREGIDKRIASGVMEEADPQVGLLSGVGGVKRELVTNVLTVLTALLVELGSSLGFFILFGGTVVHQPQSMTKPLKDVTPQSIDATLCLPTTDADVVRWISERITPDEEAFELATVLYGDFRAWCASNGVSDVSLSIFTERMKTEGFVESKWRGRNRYDGVVLTPTDQVPNVVALKST